MIFEKTKGDTQEPQPHLIPEMEKLEKRDIGMARTGTHKYNTRSSTKRVNHMTTFKNTPNMFKMDTVDTLKTNIGTDYIGSTDPPKCTIIEKPLENHINCETTGKLIWYRDLVKMDGPVWTNSMGNKLGHLS